MDERSKTLRKASVIALAGNLVLASAKLVIGLLSGSLAVVGDGIDSSTDVVVAIVTLATARIVEKPGDREHPYGHTRAETLATTLISFVIFFAGSQLFLRSVGALVSEGGVELPTRMALYVTAVSIVGKLFLAWSQFRYGKKAGSSMLIANGKNMRGDVVISCSVLVGLALAYLLGMPALDRVAALLVSLWIVKVAFGIFQETNAELMEGSAGEGHYGEIFAAVATVPGAGNPHRTRVRKLGSILVVDIDVEVDPRLTISAAHGIAMSVEAAIKARLPEVYDVVVHLEPAGNREAGERFGLSPGDHVGTDL
jgi:cation diffusion facilitator family transporter